MTKRKLGKTNIYVSPIGFGGIPIQKLSQEEANKIVEVAIQNGINFFDTARGYTVSETYLGNALKGHRNEVYIATKSMSRSYDDMKKDIEISINNLQTDYIDLYQCHNISKKEDFEKVISSDGAYKALLEAKEEGKIKHIGITSHSMDFLMEIVTNKNYQNLFETIQFPFNFIEDEAKELFDKAKKQNIGTIAMKPLGGGFIAKSETALKYLLAQESLDVAIPGMGSEKEVIQNVSLMVNEITLTNDDIKYIEKTRKEAKEEFCHRCGYCLPCTKGIDIPSIFTLENYYDRYGLKKWAKVRYDNTKIKASECINCQVCIKRCPYGINIPQRLKRIVNKFEV